MNGSCCRRGFIGMVLLFGRLFFHAFAAMGAEGYVFLDHLTAILTIHNLSSKSNQ
jgi:hypothetical protein